MTSATMIRMASKAKSSMLPEEPRCLPANSGRPLAAQDLECAALKRLIIAAIKLIGCLTRERPLGDDGAFFCVAWHSRPPISLSRRDRANSALWRNRPVALTFIKMQRRRYLR